MQNSYRVGEVGNRPWGSWVVDEIGDGFIKKTITVNVAGCLSLQSHKYRAEKWEIVVGIAEVIVDDEKLILSAGATVDIRIGAIHRLKNAGNEILIVKEIQFGDVLDENDILRYEDVYQRNETIFIADMDGTLTPARLPMTDEFTDFFVQFISKHRFYIVSGSDWGKVQEQLCKEVWNDVAGVYCSMGNEFYVRGKLVYQNDFVPETSLLVKLEEYRRKTKYKGQLFGNYIEKRIGMVNFSVLGRDCPMEARMLYSEWDKKHEERIRIAEELSVLYPQYDISVGGNVSIDIVPHGFGKEQIAFKLRKIYRNEKLVFLGDRTQKGGNDYSLARSLLKLGNTEVIAVDSPDDTLKYLRRML